MAKCPKCEKAVTRLRPEKVPVAGEERDSSGVVYCCPECDTILGASLDPSALAYRISHRLKGS